MAKGTFKVGGGDNPMHKKTDGHPFGSAAGRKASSKFGKSEATGPTAASRPGMRSANPAMKSKKV
jgi:hypothetical protein